MIRRRAFFATVVMIISMILTSGCVGYILARPDSLIARLEREINRGREDRILELYAEEIWIATSGSPLGRTLPKDTVASFYADFFELYDGISYTVEVDRERVERDSREATMTVFFTLDYSSGEEKYSKSGESTIFLTGIDSQWKISGEFNNPIISFFEPASM
ncbi:hypothetical protein V511_07715 [Mesotoga sp. Brook.08.YT.4.2.5.1]|uniref:hypothetical protein n=1 Tax=unclassified Mesotoga TaxID=1184398 RepID=UPI000C9A30BA|nr:MULTISPECIES: hypothetical protein [unclassified Mesotoga]PNE22434.1 hypothetical protein V511_07715 [Mesotoga sp. Brook.08.YT.4.2.5.1]PNS40261.1 hypothetical protein RJ60_07485 [Mesotoga sp. B105.6.4]RAO98209.1 hypothetical protein M388_07690 [Mesotoga sp. Brook.08.YT.4.2.5.4.]RDI93161.1 hypothetical protein Q502_07900 [Mesotoga sp. Brook.08.YT.4.2.5.2.]